MRLKHTAAAFFVTAVLSLSSGCGGGGSDRGDTDVVIYGQCGNVPNYRSQVTLNRWRKFPITVGLDFSAAPQFNNPTIAAIYLRAVQAAASGWSVGGGIGVVNFVVGSNADITIAFDGSTGPSGNNAGVGIPQLDSNGYIRSAGILLNSSWYRDILAIQPLDLYEFNVRRIVLHEMGHALFAVGHSANPVDIMAAAVPSDKLTQADINTIREAYCAKR